MKSQWGCLLENLGNWQGSFTQLSPSGALIQNTLTEVALEGLNDNQTIRQFIRRYPAGRSAAPEEKILEYSTLGRGILFFDNGAFSQGSLQLAPFSEFGAELGFIWGDRRLRLVQLFDRDNTLSQLTLIREERAGSGAPERSPLTLDQLLGDWQGNVVTLYPDFRTPEPYQSLLKLRQEGDRLTQQLILGKGNGGHTLASSARIEGSQLFFEEGNQLIQVILLPDGASSTCPLSIKRHQRFFLEAGWLVEPGLRQRMIRSYNEKGEWVSLTLVTERKVTEQTVRE